MIQTTLGILKCALPLCTAELRLFSRPDMAYFLIRVSGRLWVSGRMVRPLLPES